MSLINAVRGLIAYAVLFCGVPTAAAQTGDQFYHGKTMSLVIGAGVGGGYDAYGRLVARHVGRYIPGRPSILPMNMPGAGGNTAAGHVYAIAPRDGSVMLATSSGALLDSLLRENSSARHQPLKFNFIGSAGSEVAVCAVRRDAPAKTFREVFEKELIIGTSGGTTLNLPLALNRILGTKLKLVSGYKGSGDVMLAIEKGEVHGLCGIGYHATLLQRPKWFGPDSPVGALVQETTNSLPELNQMQVPMALDYAKSEEQRRILEIIYAQLAFTRPFMMGPDVPSDRVQTVRDAFKKALADPQLIAEGRKTNLIIDYMPGEDLEATLRGLYSTPFEIIDKVRKTLLVQ